MWIIILPVFVVLLVLGIIQLVFLSLIIFRKKQKAETFVYWLLPSFVPSIYLVHIINKMMCVTGQWFGENCLYWNPDSEIPFEYMWLILVLFIAGMVYIFVNKKKKKNIINNK